jgi:hypothetical protein
MKKTTIGTLVSLVFCLSLIGSGFCQDAAKDEKKKEPVVKSDAKQVQGEVSYITKRSISLVTSRDKDTGDENEILLPYNNKLVIEHKKSLSEIQTGDIVAVKYLDETIDYGDRQENKILAKVLTFISPANQDSPYRKAREAAQQDTAQQDTAQQESLPLKGEKSDEQ